MMLNCKDITRLASMAMDERLPPLARARIRFHLFLCRPCRVFHEQIALIRKAIEGCCASAEADAPGSGEMGQKCRERMKERLRRENPK